MPQTPLRSTFAGCDLEAYLQVDADELTIKYEFRNASERTAFVFNQLFLDPGDDPLRVDPNLVWVTAGPGGVTLAKTIPPVPDGELVERAYVPGASSVAPGARLSETIRLQLPLQTRSPYQQSAAGVAVSTLPATFELGFFLGIAGARGMAFEARTTTGTTLIFDPFDRDSQQVIRVGPFATLPVRAAGEAGDEGETA